MKRIQRRELMEEQGIDRERHLNTLRQFRVLNLFFSRYRSLLTRYVLEDMARKPGKHYRLLDIGAGGCDIARWLAREAGRRGLRLSITCLDNDRRIRPYQEEVTDGYPGITLLTMDALGIGTLEPYDYIISNNFLHHLGADEVRILLRLIETRTRNVYMVSDIRRSRAAYVLFAVFGRLFLHRSYAYPDGLISFRRAYTSSELRRIGSSDTGEKPAGVSRVAPFRLLITGRGTAGGESTDTFRESPDP